MSHLSKHFLAFFRELAANNDREWFQAHKSRFEEHVKAPFEALTGDVIARMRKLDPQITLDTKDAVFRIYRDIRFSKDKSPYKLYMAAVVSRGGRKDHSYPGLYFQIGVDGLAIAGGVWEPDKDNLLKIRKAIAKDPLTFRKILDNKKFAKTFQGLGGEKNKVIPKAFKDTAALVPEIYNKSFHYWAAYRSAGDVTRADLAGFIVDHYKVGRELNDWLAAALGKKR